MVACPKCNAPKGKKCRTIATRKSTDTHKARMDLAYPPRQWPRALRELS